jgi:predicted GIY-YIG superfamily endonuclease
MTEEEGYLYVFRDPKHRGAVKIGCSNNLNRRTGEHKICGL